MSKVHEGSKVIKNVKGLQRLIKTVSRMIWPATAPFVTSTTTFYAADKPDNTYTVVVGVAFNESCSKLETTPPINYAVGHDIFTEDLGGLTKVVQSSEVAASSGGIQLSGNISVNYDTGCVYYDTDSMLSMSSYSYPLQGIVIISWKPQVSPVFRSSQFLRSATPSWYPNVYNVLTIGPKDSGTEHCLEIVTQINNLYSSEGVGNINFTIKGNEANPEELHYTLDFNLNNDTSVSTPLITRNPGPKYPGLNSMLKVDFKQGCIYFDNESDQDPVLYKPTDENSEYAKDFQIRFVKIFDWLGLAIPGVISQNS